MRHTIGILAALFCLGSVTPAIGQIVAVDPPVFCAPDDTTVIRFMHPSSGHVTLAVRDVLDNEVDVILDELMPAGVFEVAWNGVTQAADTLSTGEYTLRLQTDTITDEAPVDILCSDLGGPFRRQVAGQDVQIAFAVGAQTTTSGTLELLDADGVVPIRLLHEGTFPAGVSSYLWDLRDEDGVLVDSGDYLCRLHLGAISEILFPVVADIVPTCALTVRARDAEGLVVAGSADPASPTALETPASEWWFTFDRSLTEDELNLFFATFTATGPLGLVAGGDEPEIAPDLSEVHITGLEPGFDLVWADLWGHGSIETEVPWFFPREGHFRLGHRFSGLTMTDELGAIIGEPDTTDWQCHGIDFQTPDGRDGVPVAFALGPAYPNPAPRSPLTPVNIPFAMPAADSVHVYVVDTAGQRVRTLVAAWLAAGMHQITWDHTDDGGALLPADIYRVFMEVRDVGEEYGVYCGGDVRLGMSGVGAGDPAPPVHALSVRAFPNPFNPRTTLHLALPRGGPVDLAVYDLRGRRVRQLLHGEVLTAGRHDVAWDGRDGGGHRQASGIYVARLTSAGTVATTRAVLLK